jgi:hypothetical protein
MLRSGEATFNEFFDRRGNLVTLDELREAA